MGRPPKRLSRPLGPKAKPLEFNPEEMLRQLAGGLIKQARKPNLLGYKPHEKQVAFHSSQARRRLYIGGNQCLAGGTLVLMADGSEKAIEDISVGEYVVAASGKATLVTAVWNNGEKLVNSYSIGRYQDRVEVVCTPEHEFYAAREVHGALTRFAKHPVGTLVSTRGRHKIMRSQGTNLGGIYESRAFVLGLMLGDGYIADTPGRMQFTCADLSLVDHSIFKKSGNIQYRFIKPQEWFNWFGELGLHGTRSATKFIPKVVWSWSEDSIAELCAALIVTDGSFYKPAAAEEYAVAYNSNSLEMITEFRRLMGIRLGIWGSTIMSDGRGNYSVTYATSEALEKISKLPLRGCKDEKKFNHLFKLRKNSYSSHVGVHSGIVTGKVATYDVTVEDSEHCFMLASGLITSNSGKTTGGIIESLWWLTRRHPYRRIPDIPIYGRVCAVDFQSLRTVIIGGEDDSGLKRWIVPSDLINGSWEDSYMDGEKTLYLANGSTLEFKSYDQQILQHAGRSLHFIHFDEPPPKGIYIENKVRTAARYADFAGSGSWWMTYTPIFGMDWTYDEIYLPGKENPGLSGIDIIEVDMKDNPHITDQARKDVLDGLPDDEKQAREHGRYIQLGGNIFKDFDPSYHVINEADLYEFWGGDKIPNDWKLYFSLDHGLNAPTAIYWHAVGPDGTVITFKEIYAAERLVSDHAKEVHRIEREEIGRPPDLRTGDPAIVQRNAQTGTSIQQAYSELGIWIYVDSVPKDVSIGIVKMRQHMRINPATRKPYWQILDNCPNLISELKRIHWKTFSSLKMRDSNNPIEQVHKYKDHAFDSVRYFFTFMPDLSPDTPVVEVAETFPNTSLAFNQLNMQPLSEPHSPLMLNNRGWTVVDAPQDEYNFEGD